MILLYKCGNSQTFHVYALSAIIIYLYKTKDKVQKGTREVLEAGAGGNWRVFDEILDPNVVKQSSTLACAPACGEMLLSARGVKVTQDMIERLTGTPVSVKVLAPALQRLDPNPFRRWAGGTIVIPGVTRDEHLVRTLNTTGSWAAVMWEPGASIGHLVVVDGLDSIGRVSIRDPWDGTSYKMEMKDFVVSWSLLAVYSPP